MTGLLLRDYHWLSDLIAGAAVGVVLLQVERLALRHWLRARRGSSPADPAGVTRPSGLDGGPRVGDPAATGDSRRAVGPDPARDVPAAGRADARRGS
jgi:hypothetical protein